MTEQQKIQLIKKITAEYIKTMKEIQRQYLVEMHRIHKEVDAREIQVVRFALLKKRKR